MTKHVKHKKKWKSLHVDTHFTFFFSIILSFLYIFCLLVVESIATTRQFLRDALTYFFIGEISQ